MPPSPASLTAPLTIAARPELTGGRRIGVLLSHGFTGSPASIRPWGEYLGELGYGVAVPRLPGHGTTWQELNQRTWADWHSEIISTFDALRADHDAVVIGGLSMGGAQVLQLAAARNSEIAGVMLVNPAVSTKRLDVKLLPVLKHLVGSFPAIGNDIKKPGADELAYARTPLKAAHSMMQAWPGIIRDLPKITVPVIYFRADDDHVVDASSEKIINAQISSVDVTRVPLPESYHVATLDNDAPTIFEQSAAFIARVAG